MIPSSVCFSGLAHRVSVRRFVGFLVYHFSFGHVIQALILTHTLTHYRKSHGVLPTLVYLGTSIYAPYSTYSTFSHYKNLRRAPHHRTVRFMLRLGILV
jgi:hypothetical protein